MSSGVDVHNKASAKAAKDAEEMWNNFTHWGMISAIFVCGVLSLMALFLT